MADVIGGFIIGFFSFPIIFAFIFWLEDKWDEYCHARDYKIEKRKEGAKGD